MVCNTAVADIPGRASQARLAPSICSGGERGSERQEMRLGYMGSAKSSRLECQWKEFGHFNRQWETWKVVELRRVRPKPTEESTLENKCRIVKMERGGK